MEIVKFDIKNLLLVIVLINYFIVNYLPIKFKNQIISINKDLFIPECLSLLLIAKYLCFFKKRKQTNNISFNKLSINRIINRYYIK